MIYKLLSFGLFVVSFWFIYFKMSNIQLSALLKPDIPKILRRNATIPCGIQIIHRKTNGNSNFYVKHEKIELPFHIHQDDDLHKGIMVVLGYGNESAKYDDAEIKKKSTTYLKKEGIYCIHCTLPEYVAASLEAQRLRAISKQNELMAEKCTKLLNALNKAYELPKLSPTQYRESFHKKPASITNTWYDRTSARNVGGYPR